MDVILIPGFWLDASSWAPVTAALRESGHTPHPVTTLGTGDPRASTVTLADQAADVCELLDTLTPPVVVVGHSGGGAVAHAVVDARPDRVARVVYVDSGPLGDAGVINPGLPVVDGVVPLPDWALFGPAELLDLTPDMLADFRSRALSVPAQVAAGPQRLSDDRRFEVPVTVITSTMSADQLRALMAAGHPYMAELSRVRSVDIVELPTGHWPQFTKPAELAGQISRIVNATAGALP